MRYQSSPCSAVGIVRSVNGNMLASGVAHFALQGVSSVVTMKTKSDTITIERKTFLDLCAAAEGARAWMAHNAPCTDWANRVRANLHNAIAAAVASDSEELYRLAHIQPANPQ